MNTNLKTLSGKKIILLGASSGIGLATAIAAAQEGAKVIIVSSNIDRINNALRQLPENSEGFAIDLSKESNIGSFFKKIGNFDHLIYTAGENLQLSLISETDIDATKSFFDLRFWSAVAAVKYATSFINPGGSISLTSGTANARPAAGWSVASAICGAMEAFVRAMAVELAPIRVNCVVPGVLKSNLWDTMPEADREDMYKYYADTLLLKRVGETEDVADGFLYLMKQQHGTGQSLVIDGGTLLI
ncbi:short-chain dehydrogenase [Flavobacterium sp. MEB061]|uniref:SDR family oxidoreductase n=1 Tax=Flavobacterium sp. MEB061 TaxID=1587524 RepID=UPI0005ABC272|nr:SDR family oxidoreductase [Flavobacterium sp. MEB061]KIQ14505.1 short-chain dehydrogenase [Flavobacterium sp. MEB061]